MLKPNLINTDHRILCAFCRGTGKDRFGIMSALSTCSVCHGNRFQKIEGYSDFVTVRVQELIKRWDSIAILVMGQHSSNFRV